MRLCIDIGNTHIYGGVFESEQSSSKLLFTFRYPSLKTLTADQFGLFLCNLLTQKGLNKSQIRNIGIGSVVNNLDYSVRHACKKYLNLEPYFLSYNSNFNFEIASNPMETGSDLIAACLAACDKYANENKIILDFGTATTVSLIKNNCLAGVAILPGLKTSMQALSQNAEALSNIELNRPKGPVGITTTACVQSGLYFTQLGGIKEICERIIKQDLSNVRPKIIATGGFAQLFKDEKLFDAWEPHLVLRGILLALEKSL